MIVHIKVGVVKENGKWIGRWQSANCLPENVISVTDTESAVEILANRREELERKLDKSLRLAFPKANYIVQHREQLEEYA